MFYNVRNGSVESVIFFCFKNVAYNFYMATGQIFSGESSPEVVSPVLVRSVHDLAE